MKLNIVERAGIDVAIVTLSRRNVLALLHKLDMPESHRTLFSGDTFSEGVPVANLRLMVQVEDDPVHYVAREAPGMMHPDTEAFVTNHLQKLD